MTFSAAVYPAHIHLSRRIVTSIVIVTALFFICGVIALRFGGTLSATFLGIIASVLAPTLAALFAMLVVNPLRALTKATERNGDDIVEVKTLVDGQMTSLRNELRLMRQQNASLIEKVQNLTSTSLAKDVAAANLSDAKADRVEADRRQDERDVQNNAREDARDARREGHDSTA